MLHGFIYFMRKKYYSERNDVVLLHNSNVYTLFPVGHSVTVKEEHNTIRIVLEKIKYADHL